MFEEVDKEFSLAQIVKDRADAFLPEKILFSVFDDLPDFRLRTVTEKDGVVTITYIINQGPITIRHVTCVLENK
jgi:hypothetical protein